MASAAPQPTPPANSVSLLGDEASAPDTESVRTILQRRIPAVVSEWLKRAKESNELNQLELSDEERTGYLPKLVEDLIVRLDGDRLTSTEQKAFGSASAVAHGELRFRQGYPASMLIHESRILQVTLFGILNHDLNLLDFSFVLPDVMTIADEVDAQLTQAMTAYMELYSDSCLAWTDRQSRG